MPFVYSTATAPRLSQYEKPRHGSDSKASPGHNKLLKTVRINGGANLATKHLVTPKGVATEVSEEDLKFLLENPSFIRHMEAGFISVDKKKVDPDKKAESMQAADGSAPLTPKDFEKGENSDETTKVFKGPPKSRRT